MKFLLAITCLIISGTTLTAQSYPPVQQQEKTCKNDKACTPESVTPGTNEQHGQELQQDQSHQTSRPSREEINAQKIAFFTQELNLTAQEAEKFWPVYNESWRERGKARHETMANLNKLNKALEDADVSDTQIQTLSDAYIKSFKREGDIYISYFNDFKKILPLRKAVKVFSAEEKFRVILIKQLRGHK